MWLHLVCYMILFFRRSVNIDLCVPLKQNELKITFEYFAGSVP